MDIIRIKEKNKKIKVKNITSLFSWLNGISVLVLVVGAWIFAIYFTVQYIKNKVKMYPYVAGIGYCEAIGFSGILLSFIVVLMGEDANKFAHIVSIISYSTVGIGFWLTMYIAWDTFFKPKYKKRALIILAINSIGFYIIVYGFMDIMVYTPKVASGEILDDSLTYFSLAWFAIAIIGIIIFALLAMSFLRIRKKTTGIVKKKATYLFFGYTIMSLGVMLDTMIIFDYIFIVRIFLTFTFYLWYKGL